jgi:rhodanese-related sulfurtransferase
MILYCNGPSCGKSKRTSEQLVALGYTNVRRYQLGLPMWRALSLTVQTDLPGLAYMYQRDHTTVFVDARTPSEFHAGSMPGAVNVQAGEATAANDDGRLPFRDKGARVVVFGNTASQARTVATEIAKKAYWNSSFFGGSLADLLDAGFINHPPVAASRNVTLAAGPSCNALVAPGLIDNGSYDIDEGDVLSLSIDPAGPLGLGVHTLTLTAIDSHGASATATALATIADQTAPTLGPIAIARDERTPVRYGMKRFTVSYDAGDNCGAVSIVLGVSNANGGDVSAEVLDANHVLVKAGEDVGAWLTITATDGAGNQSTRRIPFRDNR